MSKDWTTSPEHPGYKCKTITRGNFTVHIFRPILDRTESAKREDHLKNVAERALKNYIPKTEH